LLEALVTGHTVIYNMKLNAIVTSIDVSGKIHVAVHLYSCLFVCI